MNTLVVGSGLLGGALRRVGAGAVVGLRGVPWDSPVDATLHLRRELRVHAATKGWRIAWTAGAGVVGSDASSLRRETEYLAVALDEIARTATSPGRFFLASSAGGVHGAGSSQIITENTTPAPTSDYGRNKLLQESLVAAWATTTGHDALIGRISNLYGPGQKLRKQQGLITQALWRCLLALPIELAVPEETQRDYLFVDDAAARIIAWLQGPPAGGSTVKLLAAGKSVTISRLLHVVHATSGIQPRVIRRSNLASVLQPLHLRFRSKALTTLDHGRGRSIEVGVKQTWIDLVLQHARGELKRP